MKLIIRAFVIFMSIMLAGIVSADEDKQKDPEKTQYSNIEKLEDAVPIVVWNRTVAELRASNEDTTAVERAHRAVERIKALRPLGNYEILATGVTDNESGQKAFLIATKTEVLFALFPEDIDPSKGETLETTAATVAKTLKTVLDKRAEQLKWSTLLEGITRSAVATLLYLFIIWILRRIKNFTTTKLDRVIVKRRSSLIIAGVNLVSTTLAIERTLTRLFLFAIFLTATYLWLAFCLAQFFFTEPWADGLGFYFIDLVWGLLLGIVSAIPGIITVFIIFWITRIIVMGVSSFFEKVEKGNITITWLHPDTARASKRIVMAIIWLFSFSVAYPYIPGSNSDAFKGISVFVGVIISFGSSGFINQLMSGIVIAYSGAIHVGDYVRISDIEGTVHTLGPMTTKIATVKDEFITIPNSLATGSNIINYSRMAGEEGAVLSTAVTIGYDAPWRQIHALLLLAAKKTAGVRETPAPFVLQRALSDFYVEYELRFRIDKPKERYLVLSELHGNIQDAFNEAGVQIMSPHFELQPDNDVLSPKSQWYTSPASQPDPEDTK